MASRGWEGVTPTDIARRSHARVAPSPVRGHKFRAEPCIVTANGTLFTAADIAAAEQGAGVASDGTLRERAARVGIAGTWFASIKEGRRYLELRVLAASGAIDDLRLQVTYNLTVTSKIDGLERVIGNYIADFVYWRGGERIVEDSKGFRNQLYLRSKKHLQAQYGLKILET
jgi:uncharacterized protein DUF1064